MLSVPSIPTTYTPYLFPTNLQGKFTNRSPREYVSEMHKKEKKLPWERKFLRAEGAQQNGFES